LKRGRKEKKTVRGALWLRARELRERDCCKSSRRIRRSGRKHKSAKVIAKRGVVGWRSSLVIRSVIAKRSAMTGPDCFEGAFNFTLNCFATMQVVCAPPLNALLWSGNHGRPCQPEFPHSKVYC
jgi:hypothetical protein